MTISRRITASLFVLLALIAANVGVYFAVSARKTENYEALRDASARRMLLGRLRHDVQDRRREVSILADLTLTRAQATDLETRVRALEHLVTRLEAASPDPQVRSGALRVRLLRFRDSALAVYDAVLHGDASRAAALARQADLEADGLQGELGAILRADEARVEAATEAFLAATATGDRTSLLVLICSLTIAAAGATLLSLRIRRGFAELRRGTDALATGDFSGRVAEAHDAEFRAVARSLNHMAERLEAALAEAGHARAQAEQASQAKSAFLCNMSHEFRTPLTALLGFADVVRSAAAQSGHQQIAADAEEIRLAADHLMTLVTQVVDLARIERGRMPVTIVELSIVEIAERVVHLMRPLASRSGNRLTLTVATDPGAIHSDPVKLRQILMNLLGNACKFTSDGWIGVDIGTRTSGSEAWVELRVADTGIGMTPEQAARIFEEFEQAEPTTARAHGGSGLGLAITRALCELLGGRISVTSAAGGGTTFTVLLPLHCPVQDMTSNVADPAPHGAPVA